MEVQAAAAGRRAMWAALIVAWLGWMFDGLEMGLYSWAVPPALLELLGTTDAAVTGPYLSYTICLFLVGMSAGGLLFGRLGDHLGRVRTMILTVLVYALFTGLSGFAQSFGQLAACRFLGAMGLGGEWGLGVALVMETWPNTSRPVLAGLLGGAANVGFLIAAWLTRVLSDVPELWGLPNWRIALMCGFVPALLTLVVRLFVRESERWTASRARGERSRFGELFEPSLRRHSIVGIAVSAVAVLGMWGVFQAWLQQWVQDLVQQADPLADAATVGVARAQVSLWMSYGSTTGALLGGPLAEWLGRRRSYALFCAGAFASALLLFLTCHEFGQRLLVLSAVGGVFATAFFGWLPLYLPELFPTRIRATAEGLTFNCGRVISAAGVLVTGQIAGLVGGPAKACALMSGIWLVGLIGVWFIPETKGGELPD